MADDSTTFAIQDGADNSPLVDQDDGSENTAGRRTNFNESLKQTGDNNEMTTTQTGNQNAIAGNHFSNAGAWQTGNNRILVVDQQSHGTSQRQNGNKIRHLRQNSSDSASATTNMATITQTRGAVVTDPNLVAAHRIERVTQTYTGGAQSDLTITESGTYSSWYGGGQRNTIDTVRQNGSGNTLTLSQDGVGPLLSTSGQQRRGPSNVLKNATQLGDTNTATVTQDGFQNYVESVRQVGSNNSIMLATSTALSDDNENAFGLRQNGSDDTIVGVIDGSFISVAVVQLGDSNNATFSQIGNGNSASVTQ